MTLADRSRYLAELGLVDWRLRSAETAAVTDEPATVTAETADPEPAVEPVATPEARADSLARLDWAGLEAWLEQQNYRGAQRPVFGTGVRDAELLIIGEAPGAQEDQQGVPFVGPAGQLLDRMLAAIHCSRRQNVYITNICKFRPSNNRDPGPDEIATDWPVLERQIELMNPKLVVAVGRVAAQTLLESTDSLGRMRGKAHRYPQRDLPVVVTYHPAYLLRTPQAKAESWRDLKHIAALLAHDDAGDVAQ